MTIHEALQLGALAGLAGYLGARTGQAALDFWRAWCEERTRQELAKPEPPTGFTGIPQRRYRPKLRRHPRPEEVIEP